ncbi:MAG: hypothetical protein U1E59_07755 [Amaricoccus sp.]
MRGIKSRAWLAGLLCGLFAVAGLMVPAQHARMVIERATLELAYGMPDGTLPALCDEGMGHGPADHSAALPDCLACVLMAAPGLACAPLPKLARVGAPAPVDVKVAPASVRLSFVLAGRHARAPPPASLA